MDVVGKGGGGGVGDDDGVEVGVEVEEGLVVGDFRLVGVNFFEHEEAGFLDLVVGGGGGFGEVGIASDDGFGGEGEAVFFEGVGFFL